MIWYMYMYACMHVCMFFPQRIQFIGINIYTWLFQIHDELTVSSQQGAENSLIPGSRMPFSRIQLRRTLMAEFQIDERHSGEYICLLDEMYGEGRGGGAKNCNQLNC